MTDVTVGEVLKSREAILVQFAAEKRLGIEVIRELLQTVPRQTRLKNVECEPPSLTEVSISAYHEYERWLTLLYQRFSFDSLLNLYDDIAGRHIRTKLKNFRPANSSVQAYGFGSEASQDVDPWADVTVGCVQLVAALVASIKNEAASCARRAWSGSRMPIDDQELQRYVEFWLRRKEGMIGDIAQPRVRILCLSMSTSPKKTLLWRATWPNVIREWPWPPRMSGKPPLERETYERHSTWKAIVETVIGEVRCWESRGVPVLIVLDCALGWPRKMGAIASHAAGEALLSQERQHQWREAGAIAEEEAVPLYNDWETLEEATWRDERNQFFRRATETYVRECMRAEPYGPHGLDVGADKSARTTHQALRLINLLRCSLEASLPVLTTWCGPITQSSIIEVTTVNAKGRSIRERAERVDPREPTLEDKPLALPEAGSTVGHSTFGTELESWGRITTMLGAASGFLRGRLKTPRDAEVDDDVARKEGWIWWQGFDSLPNAD